MQTIADWAPGLQYFQRLKKLHMAQIWPRSLEAETTFWTAVSRLPNLKIINADTIPIPPRLGLHFPHVIDLQLYFFPDLDYGELTHLVVTVFEQMSGLEKLMITHGFSDPLIELEGPAMRIMTIACKNLKDLSLVCRKLRKYKLWSGTKMQVHPNSSLTTRACLVISSSVLAVSSSTTGRDRPLLVTGFLPYLSLLLPLLQNPRLSSASLSSPFLRCRSQPRALCPILIIQHSVQI